MTDYSKLPKADLLKEVGMLTEQLKNATAAVSAPRSIPKTVPEADAIADCVRALDRIDESTSYGSKTAGTTSRILRHLAAKYGVNLVEMHMERCSRVHADEIDATTIGYAVQNVLGTATR